MARFHVYKASAGSGKTFTISKAYIRRLLADETAYQHILAVTFTNKATAEMKRRIVSYLAGMAAGKEEAFISQIIRDIRDDAAKGLLESALRRLAAMSDEDCRQEIRKAASRLLGSILHDYGRLSVMTIDSFFQRIIRSFAMDTGLFSNYELLLDQDEAVQQAVDVFMTGLQPRTAAEKWIAGMAEDRMNDGKGWDCRSDLVMMMNMLLRECTQTIPEEEFRLLSSQDTLKLYRDELQAIRTNYENALRQAAQKAVKVMKQCGLSPDDFSNKSSGIGAAFVKIQNGSVEQHKRLAQGVGNPDAWYPKTASRETKDRILRAYDEGMNEAAQQVAGIWEKDTAAYNSAKMILEHLPKLGLMAELRTALQNYCSEQDIFLISQSNVWLHRIIDGSDTPFIYERTGLRFSNYMIDEMQDTSCMQWDDLKPLLTESMAHGGEGWSVGDVKQAIYRFRNGDWHIMEEQIEQDIKPSCTHRLEYNFRSGKHIIDFNNTFISGMVNEVAAMQTDEEKRRQIKNIYSDLEQKVPEYRLSPADGLVEMRFIEDNGEHDWKDAALAALPGRIMFLESNGFKASDIAILIRDNKDAKVIMDYMMEWVGGHPEEAGRFTFGILDDEALRLNDALIVQWVIGALTYMTDPYEDINRTALVYNGSHGLGMDPDSILPRLDEWRARVQGLSVYEAAAALAESMHLYDCKEDVPYLQALQDFIAGYCRRMPVDTATFLECWKERGAKEYLMMPDRQDAIRLMTIHKSKGLEFGAVIMPFAEWEVMKITQGSIVWFPTKGAPFDRLSLVPVHMSSDMENSIFAEPYREEVFLSVIDSLNLIYVAFTRACRVLMVDVPKKTKNGFIGDWLHRTWESHAGEDWKKFTPEEGDAWTGEGFRTGQLADLPCKKQDSPDTRMMSSLYQPVMRRDADTRIKDHGDWFEAGPQADATARGIVLHELFSRIHRLEDLPEGLDRLAAEGMISDGDKERLTSFVQQACRKEEIRQWFAPDAEIKTEAELLLPDGTRYRPDRVVVRPDGQVMIIDYKFGTSVLRQHRQQVEAYMQTLRRMGCQAVTGYLWYVSLDKVECVGRI